MIVGTVKEIKVGENRVGLTPYGTDALKRASHQVLVEKNAGRASGFTDNEYKKAGAKILSSPAAIFKKADMIIKVKEPQKSEFKYYHPDLILFTYLHLAAEPEVTKMLLDKRVAAVAYETVEMSNGSLPLLAPMSEVAGRMAAQIGAFYLLRANGGKGKLLGGVPGVSPGKVVILGSGTVSTNAAKIALGLGADVFIFGRNLKRLRYLDDIFGPRLQTRVSHPLALEEQLKDADVVISGVLVTGAKAPKLVTKKMLAKMEKGSVIIDVSIDQGGSFETSRPTTHEDPVYEVEGVIHYCVTNMPGALPYTSTLALTNATIKYALEIAEKGLQKAAKDNSALAKGVNTIDGKLTYKVVADDLNLKYTPLEKVL